MHGIRSRSRALIAAGMASIALAAVPAAASATVATNGSAVQTQRESFMRYMYGLGFGGVVSQISPGVFATNTASYADDTLTPVFTGTGTTYDIVRATGSGVIAFDGGIDYTMTAHSVDVSLDDYRISLASARDSAAVVSAVVSYDPFETSGPQIVNPTTPARIDVFTLNLASAFSSSGTTHSWSNTVATLTAAGANAFNGGINGSYRTGDLFGSFAFTAGY
jgi:hypothetical protein